ncbi:GNAT family N-acetyltransferase [Sphingomonas sp. MA1305]|uniref:GNAT family N-acetyltransferase n=1 Tax=Sphingomonas sp. MA1305 TaxID=2479204 RepID=UPI002FCD48C5
MIEVRRDDPLSPAVAGLIDEHLAFAKANTDSAFRFALGAQKLAQPGTAFFTAWQGETLVGMGAVKRLDETHAELKSMRTADGHRGKGVGAAMLTALIAHARHEGIVRLSLETGTDDDFIPAHALYRRFGFVDCAAFADYPADSPKNRYMTLTLEV